MNEPEFIPTPEEIARMCAATQKDWSDATRRKRAGLRAKREPYTVPQYRFVVTRSGEVVAERMDDVCL